MPRSLWGLEYEKSPMLDAGLVDTETETRCFPAMPAVSLPPPSLICSSWAFGFKERNGALGHSRSGIGVTPEPETT